MNGISILAAAGFVILCAASYLTRRSWLGVSFAISAFASAVGVVLTVVAEDAAEVTLAFLVWIPFPVLLLAVVGYALGGWPDPDLPGRVRLGVNGLLGALIIGSGILLSISEGPAAIMLVALGVVPFSDAVGFHVPGATGPAPNARGRANSERRIVIDGFPRGVRAARLGWVAAAAVLVVALAITGFELDLQPLAWACTVAFCVLTAGDIVLAGGLHRLVVDADGLRWQVGRAAQQFAPWSELKTVTATQQLDGPALTAGETTIPLRAFKVDPETFASGLRRLATRPRDDDNEALWAFARALGADVRG